MGYLRLDLVGRLLLKHTIDNKIINKNNLKFNLLQRTLLINFLLGFHRSGEVVLIPVDRLVLDIHHLVTLGLPPPSDNKHSQVIADEMQK